MKKNLVILGALVASTLACAEPALALVVSGPDILMDFRFNNPGARANAMGGAFIGVADDATAAYTNPAGLTILTTPETSLEFKNTNTTNHIYFEDGSKHEFDDSNFGISFIGYAKPMEKTAFALYRHELINISEKTNDVPYTPTITTFLIDSELNVKAISYGASFAAKLHDRISLGLSVGFTEIDYYYKSDFVEANNPGTWGTNSLVNSSDRAEQYTISLLYNPFGELNIGLVYSYGPEFETIYTDNSGAFVKNLINVPDVYGAGLSYRFFNNLTVAGDVNYIKYSDLLDEFTYFNAPLAVSQTPWVGNDNKFDCHDTTEIHIGFEYVLALGDLPLALRGGYFHRPDHSIHFTDVNNPALNYLTKFREGEDDNIYSAGLGIVLNENAQVDLAASRGDLVTEYILSMVYRF